MSNPPPTPLARLIAERRHAERRESTGEPVLSLFEVFQRDERSIWRRLDRRIAIRRERDVQRRIAKL
jgi:hypothetical protein